MPEVLPADISAPYSVVFRSDFSLAESVQRLSEAVVLAGFEADATDSAKGSVTEKSVRLERARPWPRGSIVPRFRFRGSFEQHGNRSILVGQFAENLMFRLFPNPLYRLSHPSLRDEVLWLSTFIEQALTRPA